MLKSNLPPDIKQEFLDRIRAASICAADYLYEYSLQMLKCILVSKNATFIMNVNNKPKNGPLVSDILKGIYQEECSAVHLPPPLDHKLFSNTSNSRQLIQLFDFEVL